MQVAAGGVELWVVEIYISLCDEGVVHGRDMAVEAVERGSGFAKGFNYTFPDD